MSNLEQRSKDESQQLKIDWNSGPFNFLLSRTSEKYKHKAVLLRRLDCEKQLSIALPQITDEMLLALYEYACCKFQEKCQRQYEFSGFTKTPSESSFSKVLNEIIKKHPKLKHLEVYPNQNYSKDHPQNFKMVVGNYVPDFLIFGLKLNGASAVAIEIDGDSHINKWGKDDLKNKHLQQLKIFTWEVQNDQVLDFDYLEKAILEMYRLRNGSLNAQILRAKRMIWVKTISCQLSLNEIDNFVSQHFSLALNLQSETKVLPELPGCPRNISREL